MSWIHVPWLLKAVSELLPEDVKKEVLAYLLPALNEVCAYSHHRKHLFQYPLSVVSVW
jgi:hypothetical protein